MNIGPWQCKRSLTNLNVMTFGNWCQGLMIIQLLVQNGFSDTNLMKMVQLLETKLGL
ncbi:hypothetical protein PIB30_107975 [Stylosanthes scabra]|uniref:Uncharacterized protein n=1 Tax=Stylosanthes scabra TaxID=79078 RepID=A0ABU6YY43_9FABA|nr:hypothetical protein [Stylosanthes scabra]